MSISEACSFSAYGWLFVPGNRHVEGYASRSAVNAFNSIEGNLGVRTDWFAIELEGAYAVTSGLTMLAGLRYDYLQATISGSGGLEQLALLTANAQIPSKRD